MIIGLFLTTSTLQAWGAAHVPDEGELPTSQSSSICEESQLVGLHPSSQKQLPTQFKKWKELSPELQDKIFSYLDWWGTLKQLRLASKTLYYNPYLHGRLINKMFPHNDLLRQYSLTTSLLWTEETFSLVERITIWKLTRNKNLLQHIASFLLLFKNVEHLNLSENYLCTEGVKKLVPSLSQLIKLKTLDLGYTNLNNEGMKVLPPVLGQFCTLKSLSLGSNNLGIEGLEILATALKQMISLETLYLMFSDIGNEGVKVLVPALKELPKLSQLWLCGNNISPDVIEQLKSFLPDLRIFT